MKLKGKSLALVGLVLLAATSGYADDSVAVKNGQGQQANVTVEKGVQLVDIVAPGADGVSNNVYSQFHINAPGMVFKNSSQGFTSQLAGLLAGNSQLGASPARLILNQVQGRKMSNLLGAAEIGGTRADLVIANPNGLNVNGLSFINANNVTLTTASPDFSGRGGVGALTGYTLKGGRISLAGMKGEGASSVNVVGHDVAVDGKVTGDNLQLQAGKGKLGLDGVLAASGSGAIDASAMGAMKANSIIILGGSVTNKGAIEGQNLVINSRGDIINNSSIAGGDVTLVAQNDVDNLGAAKDPRNQTAGWLSANAATIEAKGNLDIVARDVENRDGALVAKNATIEARDDIENKGIIKAAENLSVSAADDFNNYAHLEAGKNLQVSADDFWAGSEIDKDPTLTRRADGSVTKTWVNSKSSELKAGGDMVVKADTIKLQAADVAAKGDVNLKANKVTSEGIWVYSNDYANEKKLIAKTKRKGEALTGITGNHVTIVGDKSVYLEGTVAKADGALTVEGKDVRTDYSRTREASHSWYGEDGSFGLNLSRKYRVVGVDLEGGESVDIKATDGNVRLDSAIVASEKGDVNVGATKDVVTTSGKDKDVEMGAGVSLKGSTFINPKLTFEGRYKADSETKGTTIVGENVAINAGGKAKLEGGAQVNANNDLIVSGQNGVVVRNGEKKHTDVEASLTLGGKGDASLKDKKAGVVLSADAALKSKTESKSLESSLTAGEVIDMRSEKGDVTLAGTTVTAPEVNLVGEKVNITTGVDRTTHYEGSAGLTVGVGGAVTTDPKLNVSLRQDAGLHLGSELNLVTEHKGSVITGDKVTIESTGEDSRLAGIRVHGSDIETSNLTLKGGAGDVKVVSATNSNVTLAGKLGIEEGFGLAVDPVAAVKAGIAAGSAVATGGATAGAVVGAVLDTVSVDKPLLGLESGATLGVKTSQKGSHIGARRLNVSTDGDLVVLSSKVKADEVQGSVGGNFIVGSKADHNTQLDVNVAGKGTVDLVNLKQAPTSGSGTVSADIFGRDTTNVATFGEVEMGSGSIDAKGDTVLEAGRLSGKGTVTSEKVVTKDKKEHDLFAGVRGGTSFSVKKEGGSEENPETHLAGDAKLDKVEATYGKAFGKVGSVVLPGITLKARQGELPHIATTAEEAEADHVEPVEKVEYKDVTPYIFKVKGWIEKLKEFVAKKDEPAPAPVPADEGEMLPEVNPDEVASPDLEGPKVTFSGNKN